MSYEITYYGMDGQRISREQMYDLMESSDGRKVAYDNRGGVTVSTVLLCIDHGFIAGGKPIIFETMIFGGKHDQYQDRYATKEEALIGHERACQLAFTSLPERLLLRFFGRKGSRSS